jgi:hypothetical protein
MSKLCFKGKTQICYTSENISSSLFNFEGKNHRSGSLQGKSSDFKERLEDSTLLRTSPALD